MAETILQLTDIRKSYAIGTPAETEVLHGVDLQLDSGDFVALMGPSGSGKSTLLNIIGLLDRPTSGKLYVQGRDTSSMDDGEITRLRGHSIGFVFQYHHLITAFTALENVMMPMLLDRGRASAAMQARALELLRKVGLEPWANNKADRLSGGQQQRVAVARALAQQPPLILADEPTGNLDSKSADSVFELMRDVCRESGGAFLLVTHSLALAQRCDRIIELVDGRVVQEGRD
ncbi:ABC transporter ATP-binding protein [Lacisediminimonas sp.]|uniref:ABC transporter ATP-binding protein n=1 Tax=Lacisediminimonas sp. TaxID=3060582 RepID=UPI0027254F61|nr:ABC transporter ATP-binding protein [Lacisediminimonas sp.]MDO8300763.1 ABC transporter ATP-binding protein [Lacisediminimonas sp.]